MKQSNFSNPVVVINGKQIPTEDVKTVEMKFNRATTPVLTIELNCPIQIGEFVTTSTTIPNGPTRSGFVVEPNEIPAETFVLSDYTLQILEKESSLRIDRTKFLPHLGVNRPDVEKRLDKLVCNRIDIQTAFYPLAGPDSEKQAIAVLKEKEKELINNEQYEVIDVALAPIGVLDNSTKNFQIKESFFVYVKANENGDQKTEN